MKRTFQHVFFIFLSISLFAGLSPLSLRAQAPNPGNDGLKELLESAGLKKLADQIPNLIELGIDQANDARQALSPKDFADLKTLAKESFSAETFYQNILAELAKTFDPAKTTQLLEWHRSPLAQKMITLEASKTTPDQLKGMGDFVLKMQTTPLPPKRQNLLKRLNTALQGTEMNVQLMVKSQYGLVRALNRVIPEDKRQTDTQLNAAEGLTTINLRHIMENQILGSWGYVYDSVADAELENYIKFYETDLGKEWSLNISKAITSAMETASTDLGNKLAKAPKITDKEPPKK